MDMTTAKRAQVLAQLRSSIARDKTAAAELLDCGRSTLRGEGYVVAHADSTMTAARADAAGAFQLRPFVAGMDLAGTIHFTRERAQAFADAWNAASPAVPVRVISRVELLREVITRADAELQSLAELEAAS